MRRIGELLVQDRTKRKKTGGGRGAHLVPKKICHKTKKTESRFELLKETSGSLMNEKVQLEMAKMNVKKK